ncbi:MAG: hypothetical protein AAGJ46_19715 [Planctomycetota bacterium]
MRLDAPQRPRTLGLAALLCWATLAAVACAEGEGPLAVLVRNPELHSDNPPYALADNRGVIQRWVEPTTTIDLAPYVGRIVRVTHDTGATLLATQLELPADPALLPGPIDTAVVQVAAVSPNPLRTAQSGERLPEPIVLEEVVGRPSGPVSGELQFPAAIGPGPSPAGVVAGPAPTNAAPCVTCGSGIPGACPNCAVVWRPQLGLGLHNLDFSVEAMLLRVHDSAAINGGDDLDLGTRWTLGYNAGYGRRWVFRYFDYAAGQQMGSLDLETIDLEFQRRFHPMHRVEWYLGGGLRWAEFDETAGITYSDTIGPLLTAGARAPAFGYWDGVLGVRQSFQFGDATINGVGADRGTFGVTEVQFGLERRLHLQAGQGFFRGFFETQYWDDVARTGPTNGSRGLVGFGLALGLAR